MNVLSAGAKPSTVCCHLHAVPHCGFGERLPPCVNLHVPHICLTHATALRMPCIPSAYTAHTQCIHSTYAVHTQYICHADQADHCDKDSMAIVTASLVNDVHSLLTSLSDNSPPQSLPLPQIPSEAKQAVKSVNPDSIVLMSHSAGAVTAVDMLAGKLYCPVLCVHHAFSCLLLLFTGLHWPLNASHCLLGVLPCFLLPSWQ